MKSAVIWHSSVLHTTSGYHAQLADRVFAQIDRQRKSTKGLNPEALEQERASVMWLLEALIQATTSFPSAALALPRRRDKYGNSQDKSVHLPYNALSRALIALESLGWLSCETGYQTAKTGTVSRFWAEGELLAYCRTKGQVWQKLTPPSRESLILISDKPNNEPRRSVEDCEGPEVALWKENLYRINELLLTKCVMLKASDEIIGEIATVATGPQKGCATSQSFQKKYVVPLHFGNVTLRRIFARNRLDYGGRFYGGWWIHIPSRYRKHIYIDNCPTVECDFSGIALRCLYAQEGLDIGPKDAYDIDLPNYKGRGDPRRSIVKEYINAALNDVDNKYILDPQKLAILGVTRKQLRALVDARHHQIAQFFHTGIGLYLQFVDSQIAEAVMLRFVEMNEAVLPIHDSFIVRKEMQGKLQQVMQEEFERITGQQCPITHDLGLEFPDYPDVPSLAPLGSNIRSWIKALRDAFLANADKFSISNRYLFSWANQTPHPPETSAAQSARSVSRANEFFKTLSPEALRHRLQP